MGAESAGPGVGTGRSKCAVTENAGSFHKSRECFHSKYWAFLPLPAHKIFPQCCESRIFFQPHFSHYTFRHRVSIYAGNKSQPKCEQPLQTELRLRKAYRELQIANG